MSYCQFVSTLPEDNIHKIYHDKSYGFPIIDDNELFGRLLLEINQAGLSWNTILLKQDNFRQAYSNFIVSDVADYGLDDIDRLLQDKGIIRNKLKVNAAIYNAREIMKLQNEFGSFKNWLDQESLVIDQDIDAWVKLFKKNFKFVGGEIVKEFLLSTGYLTSAHDENCWVIAEIKKSKGIL